MKKRVENLILSFEKLDIKRKLVFLAVFAFLFMILAFGIYANVNKSTKWQTGSQIYVSVSGFQVTLQDAINSGLLEGSSNVVGNVSNVQNPGHSFDQIWVSVDGEEMTLKQALAGNGLCGKNSPTTTYLTSPIVGHYATEIEVTVNGTVKSLQDAINDGSISEVGSCISQVSGIILFVSSNTYNYNIANNLESFNDSFNKSNITVTIESGIRVGSTSATTPSFTTGNLAVGSKVTIINNGEIRGMGGKGGAYGQPYGQKGGTAVEITVPTTINNSGLIYGGGGGGGSTNYNGGYHQDGAGGGGAGFDVGPGIAGYCYWGDGWGGYCGSSAGTLDSGGAGGCGCGCNIGGALCGGNGGGPGQPGNPPERGGAYQGAAGASVKTNGNTLTWNPQGTILGPIEA